MGKRTWMLIPLSLLFLLSQLYRTSSAVIASELMRDLSLTAEDLGLLSSVFFYAFALVQIPMGAAIDLFGVRRLMIFLSSVGVAGAVSFALANSFPMALVGRGLMGVGMACALMGTYKFISLWFPPRTFATISGFILSIGTLGNIVATAPLAFAVDWVGWRRAFLFISIIHLFITFWIYVAVKDSPEEYERLDTSSIKKESRLKDSLDGILLVLRLPSFWFIAFAAFVRYGTYISITGLWAGPYLEHVYHMTLIERGRMLMLFPIGFLVGSPLIGVISDRVFKNRKTVAVLAMSFYTIFIFPLTGFLPRTSLITLAGFFFFIGFLNSGSMVLYANIKELLPSSISGTSMSAVNFFTMSGAGFFQHVMGISIERFSIEQGQLPPEAFSLAFGLCLAASAFGVVAYLFVREVHSEEPGAGSEN
jgi:sugar phosphate permease